MPVTGLSGRIHDPVPEHSTSMDMEQVNTTSFLFDDDEKSKDSLTSPDVTRYLQMTDNNFPVLIRQNHQSGTVSKDWVDRTHLLTIGLQLSASSAALDLALNQSPGEDAKSELWDPSARHRLSLQHNLQQPGHSQNGSQSTFMSSNAQNPQEPISHAHRSNRHSMEASLAAYGQSSLGAHGESVRPSLANAHASYSTNDVPTLKNPNGLTNTTSPKNHTQQFHNHNASLGRIPLHAVSNRHSRELSSGSEAQREDHPSSYQPLNTALQTSMTPSGSLTSLSSPVESPQGPANQFNHPMAFNQPFYAGYGMQLMNMGMNPVMATPLAFQNQMQMFQQQNAFLPYANYAQQAPFQDGQSRMVQQRRMQHGEGKPSILRKRCSSPSDWICRASSLLKREA